jgi:hypothetical protein
MRVLAKLPLISAFRAARTLFTATTILTRQCVAAAAVGIPIILPALAAVGGYRHPGWVSSQCATSAFQRAASFAAHQATLPCRRAACALACAISVASAEFSTNEGLRRSLVFNRKMVPMAVEYRFMQWVLAPCTADERKPIFAAMHQRHAPEVLEAIYALRGFYIKIGQVISSFGDSFVPAKFVETLQVLQDAVPPQPPSYVRRLVEEQLDCPLEDVFSSFDVSASHPRTCSHCLPV